MGQFATDCLLNFVDLNLGLEFLQESMIETYVDSGVKIELKSENEEFKFSYSIGMVNMKFHFR